MKLGRSIFAALIVAIAVLGAQAGELWPNAADVKVRALRGAELSLSAVGAFVRTGVKSPSPGLRLEFGTPRDFSSFERLELVFTNPSPSAVRVWLNVQGESRQGKSPGGKVEIPPYARAEMIAPLEYAPWILDAPLAFKGMRGYPQAGRGSSQVFDITRVTALDLTVTQDAHPHAFALLSVSGLTAKARTDQNVLKTASFFPFVDVYGQFAHADWPGKVHSDDELRASAAEEDSFLAAHAVSPIPDCDRFGGWAGGPRLRATGFFRTEKHEGKWWLVDPDGYLFFSHGIDCLNPMVEGVTGVGFRDEYFAALPPKDDALYGRFWSVVTTKAYHGFYAEEGHYPYDAYNVQCANLLRKHGPDWRAKDAALAHRRLKAWGINTIGNWSDDRICDLRRTPYTATLSTSQAPRRAGSTGWWGALPDPFNPAFEKILRADAQALARRLKRDPYCLGVFVDNEMSWHDLPDLNVVAERYFSVISKVLKEELPGYLYLGCRIAWGNDEIYRICSRYADVVSVNIYGRVASRVLPEGAADKPMLVGEFHFGALDRGLFSPGLVAVASQKERAAAYLDYLHSALDNPAMVGTHWFQWKDQPLTGRADGENFQVGFLSGVDRPYPEMVRVAREVAATMYLRRLNGR